MDRAAPRLVLLAVTTLLLIAAGIAGYSRAELVDRDTFTARAVSALDDEDVQRAVATRITDRLTRSVSPEVLVVRPLVILAVDRLVDTSAFRRAVAAAAADVHGQLVGGSSSYVVALSASSPVLGDALRRAAPRLARALPDDLRLQIIELSPGDTTLRGVRATTALGGWWWPLVVAALIAAAAVAWLSRGLREAVALLGASVLAAGLTVAVSVAVLEQMIVRTDDPVRRGARSAIWTALMGDLRSSAILAAIAGALALATVAAAGAADPLTRSARALGRVTRSSRPELRVARALLVGMLGVGLLLSPALVASVLAAAAGAGLILVAVAQLRPGPRSLVGAPRTPVASPSAGRLLAGAVAAPAAAMLIVVVLVLPAPATPPAAPERNTAVCNGTAALCGRRLDEVVFPGTHNSYSAADEPGWLFANQRFGIDQQLRDGIRALLVDVHYGVTDAESGRVRTDLKTEGSSRSKVAQELSPGALRVADRLGTRVGGPLEGPRRSYMCHTLCELGAEPLADQFRLIRDFLDAEPQETVVLFVESYVTVAEIEQALEEVGLLPQAARLDRDEPLPTLGELVAADTRLVVLAEEKGGARPWFLPGFSFAQDTPLGARTAGQLRCDRFRGEADSPLLLLNHWIDSFPPSPSRNRRIGGRVLADRVERCDRERGQLPNLLAVDFYESSDVVAVAAERNR